MMELNWPSYDRCYRMDLGKYFYQVVCRLVSDPDDLAVRVIAEG